MRSVTSPPRKSTDQDTSPLELLRRMENMLRLGTVAEVRLTAPALCRVQCGGLVTHWLPWLTARAGSATTWWPPSVGEQCLVLAPGGDLLNAVVLPAAYCDAFPQNSDSATEHRTTWANGDTLVHDSATGALHITCAHSITFQVGATVLTLTPEGATITPDLVGAGHVSLVNHRHTQVRGGPDLSGVPQ
jgi:phage baseplate assembly protein V